MKARHTSLSLLLLSLATLVQSHRRVLHEPLFPSLSSPPSTPPPPDQVLAREPPAAPTPGPATPNPPALHGTVVASSATQSTPAETPAKKVAIAASVVIVSLGMLSALAFYLCRHYCSKRHAESQKLVGGGGGGGANRETLAPPPSNLFYIGAVEPSPSPPAEAPVIAASSPYRKLRPVLDQDRYRPSPELQPLPPLTDQQQRRWSPSPGLSVSESEEEGGRPSSAFYTPSAMSASSIRNDDGYQYHTPQSRLSYANNASSSAGSRASVFRSKRSSPKSRFSVSPIDSRQVIVPAGIQQSPSPNAGLRRTMQASPPPPPPPPPPLPPPKLWNSERSDSSAPSSTKNTSPPDTKSSSDVEGANRSLGSSDAGGKLKLKPLHWDKVPATSDQATVWDQLKSTSFQLNEDKMETLFGCNSTNVFQKEAIRKPFLPHFEEENNVLDPKKSQNIAVLLRALNVTSAEVAAALLDGNMEGLGGELLETLVRMAPTKEEEIKLRDYNGDISKLGSAERFLKAVLDVPFAFKRVEAMLYRANFDSELKYLRNSYQTLETATEELKNCRLFLKLLEAVLQAGNRMNMGTNRGGARAFKLDTLLKLADVKGTDGKTTLLHFVVQLITESEDSTSPDLTKEGNYQKQMDFKNDVKKQELQVVAGLSRELGNVKKAAGIDSDVLNGYVTKLEEGLEKIHLVLQYEMPNMQGQFFESMKLFLRGAKEDIAKIKADEREALSHVKEVTTYFHGDAAKEEAHPLRIFVIVKDFLNILDHVCKDVGRVVGSARLFQIPATASR